jgi:hypothetical protein
VKNFAGFFVIVNIVKVELPGVEPGSEMVYRSSIYMRSHRLKFRMRLRPVTRQPQAILLKFHNTCGRHTPAAILL